jgi:exopolysaccharide biosynthesis protein
LVRGDTLLLHLAPREAALNAGDTVQLRLRIVGRTPIAPREAVGGRPMLVVDSMVVNDVETEGNAGFRGLNPRSALGLHPGNKRLWLAVIDGRRPGVTMGTTLRQTAELMRALGATQALNLDGGGSSALVLRDLEGGAVRVVNSPSDPTERAVGNALAVQASCQRMWPSRAPFGTQRIPIP